MFAHELRNLSEDTLKKLDKEDYCWTASHVANWVKKAYELQDKNNELVESYNELYNIYLNFKEKELDIFKGLILKYTIKCPNCGDKYSISLREYNYNIKVNCYKCNHEYAQCDNIVSYGTLDREAADKMLGYK